MTYYGNRKYLLRIYGTEEETGQVPQGHDIVYVDYQSRMTSEGESKSEARRPMKSGADKRLRAEQAGFQRGRSTTDLWAKGRPPQNNLAPYCGKREGNERLELLLITKHKGTRMEKIDTD